VKDGVAPVPFAVHDVLVSFKTDHTNKEALSKFLDFLYDDANYAEMIVREGFLPVSSRVGDKLSAADPEMRSSLEALAKANFYPVQKPEWQAVMDNARKLGDAVLYDHLSPKAALDELQQFAISRSRP
jgi:multiple sugar transport system substrate-binding protein